MKKILLIHTEYTQTGGEDIAVRKETDFLKKHFKVDSLVFQNTKSLKINDLVSFFLNRNNKSVIKLKKKIEEFQPDYIYIHNLWFKASLGILDFVLKDKLEVFLKVHNFRYDCTKSFLSSVHLKKENICKACGLQRKRVGFFNKYYEDSFAKSVLVNNFGKKYFRMLQNKNLKILTLTKHHKDYLIKLGFDSDNIFVQPNPMPNLSNTINKETKKKNQIIYAGRISEEKGLEELIDAWQSIDTKDYKLKIIGEGPFYSNIEKLIEKINTIDLIKYKENQEVLEIINESKAVVTATKLYEGQPTLLCEASILSVPSIFPDSGGIKDYFPEGYDLKFEQYNYKDLAEKLKKVINSTNLKIQGEKNKSYIIDYLNEENLLLSLKSTLENRE